MTKCINCNDIGYTSVRNGDDDVICEVFKDSGEQPKCLKTYNTLEVATLITKRGWAENMKFRPIVQITSDVNRIPMSMLEKSEIRFALHYPSAIETLVQLNPHLIYMLELGEQMTPSNYRNLRKQVLKHYGYHVTVDIGV